MEVMNIAVDIAVDIAYDRHPSHNPTDTQNNSHSQILSEGLHCCQRNRYFQNSLTQFHRR